MKTKIENNGIAYITKVVIAVLLLCFLVFSVLDRLNGHLTKVDIKIKTRGDKKYLINKKDVKHLLKNKLGYDISIANVGDINLYELESYLESDERVSRAEMFLDKGNKLTIGILQNLPISRIEVTGGEDYYLDPVGKRIPIRGDIVRVPVVTGHIDDYVSNYKKKSSHNLNYILSVSQKLYEDDFLSALVDQIYITEEDDIILIPKLGRQRIALGPDENLDDKMYKLKTYYKKGVKNMGIDRFEELNLRYDGQIVGTRKES